MQMKKRAWRRSGKPAMSQHRSQDPPGTALLKESICQTCLHRGPPGSTLRAGAPAGIGPLTPRHTHSPRWPPKVLPTVSSDQPPACTHSIGSLIKQPPLRAGDMLRRSGHCSLRLMGQPGEAFVCARLPHIPQNVRRDNARRDGRL